MICRPLDIQVAGLSLQYDVYRVPLADRLPTIRFPRRESDGDVPLVLQALLDRTYDVGGYDDLDSTRELDPPLSSADAAWSDERLRKRALR